MFSSNNKIVVDSDGIYWSAHRYHALDRHKIQSKGSMVPIQISSLLKTGFESSSAVDIGANAGYWTLPLSQSFFRVFAFEPNDEVRAKLNKNVEINNELASKILISSDAVGSISSIIDFYEISLLDGDKLLNNGLSGTFHRGLNIKPRKVNQIKLDSYILTLKKLDFIKIDVEGMEYSVLLGASQIIRLNFPLIYWEASHTLDAALGANNVQNCFSFLNAAGYRHFSYIDGEFVLLVTGCNSLQDLQDCDILSVPEKSLNVVSSFLIS